MLQRADIKNFSPYFIPSVLSHNLPVYGYSLNDLEPRSATLDTGFYDNDVVYFISVIKLRRIDKHTVMKYALTLLILKEII